MKQNEFIWVVISSNRQDEVKISERCCRHVIINIMPNRALFVLESWIWLEEAQLLLTWSLGSLLGGRVLAFGLDGGRVEDPGGGAVLAEVLLQAFDGAIQLAGPDLVVDVHEIWRGEKRRGNIIKAGAGPE